MALSLRSTLRKPPVWFTLSAVAAVIAYQTWMRVDGDEKLAASGLDKANGISRIEVVMTVHPEQFNLTVLQDAGRLVKVEGRRAFMIGVTDRELHSLARKYWIEAVRPWPIR